MKGKGVSEGLAMGLVFRYQEQEIQIKKEYDSLEEEAALYKRAAFQVKENVKRLRDKAALEGGKEAEDILQAHVEVLEDTVLEEEILEKIKTGNSAMCAVQDVMEQYAMTMEAIPDAYMKERALDIRDIEGQLLREIAPSGTPHLDEITYPVILAARELTPSITAGLNTEYIRGFLTETGGENSHTAILARMLEIPAVVGVKGLMNTLREGEKIILDGTEGTVIVNPDDEQILAYEKRKKELETERQIPRAYYGRETRTKTGTRMALMANIGGAKDLPKAMGYGPEGVGLFRTEYLYMNRQQPPSEEEQYQIYSEVIDRMKPLPVIVRTLDIGGDKQVPYLKEGEEENPFLGLRAIRLCLKRRDIFKTQLRALLRASVKGNLRIMFPMISTLEELRSAKTLLRECGQELAKEGIGYDEDIAVGMMIEVPAAAVMAAQFAKECDFFSIGTNDLTQYTLAVDRGNENVAKLYKTNHPAVLELIKKTAEAAHEAEIPCGICGEAACDGELVPTWIAMGIEELSMSAVQIPKVRRIICETE